MGRTALKRLIGIPLVIIGSFVALLLLVSIVAQIILSPSVSEKLIHKYAPAYLDGEVRMSRASISVFRHFPRFTADIDSLLVTYPSQRFDRIKRQGDQGILAVAGNYVPKGEADTLQRMDTLASFSRFSASVNVFALLRGVLRLNDVRLYQPRVFIHYYADGSSNLDIVKLDVGEQEKDSTSTSLPRLVVKKLYLGDKPVIVYTDQADSLMTTLRLKEFSFDGKLQSHSLQTSTFHTRMDSLIVAGRMGSDTLLFNMNYLDIDSHNGKMDVDAHAVASVATGKYGRIRLPLGLEGKVNVRNASPEVISLDFQDVDLDVATVCLQADMQVELTDVINMNGGIRMPMVDVQNVLDDYVVSVIPQAAKLHTDAKVEASLIVEGYYDPKTGELPSFLGDVNIPRSYIRHQDYDYVPSVDLKMTVLGIQGGEIDASLDRCCILAPGVDLDLTAEVDDLSGRDPHFTMDGALDARLDSLGMILADKMDIFVGGKLDATAKGKFNLSHISMYNFANADVNAKMELRDIVLESYDDSLKVVVDSAGMRVALMDDRFRKESSFKDRSLGAMLAVDSVSLRYKSLASIGGRDLSVYFQGSTDRVEYADTLRYHPLRARLRIGRARLVGEDSVYLSLRGSENTFRLLPSKEDNRIPTVSIKSSNKAIRGGKGATKVSLSNIDFTADAKMADPHRKRRLKTLVDSLNRLHPELQPDSVLSYLRQNSKREKLPQWLNEDDFKKKDINLNFGESFMKQYRLWNVNGDISIARGRLSTPLFPIRTGFSGFKGNFNNDRIILDTISLRAGVSQVDAEGSVTNLRRALAKRGAVKLHFAAFSDTLDVNELLSAYAAGQAAPKQDATRINLADFEKDDDFEKEHREFADSLSKLIVVPGNLDADVMLSAKGVNYSGLHMSRLETDIIAKDRCLQLTNTMALTNVGGFKLDAFYSTLTKDDVTVGFDLGLNDISAGEAINLIPQIDTLMPLLKSFDGKLNCTIAATAKVDTGMNVVTNSINGVMRITGDDLHFNENKQVTRIAKLLWVKHPGRATIDHMMVEGIVKDNTVEVFPFIVKLENWTLALAGVQHLDDSFDYHVSIIRSPFGIRLGANFNGDNFDHLKFRLGKARYKNVNVPSFSHVIDTTRINLVNSIKNIFEVGVSNAVRRHNELRAIKQARAEQGYEKSAALDSLDEVSDSERSVMDSLSVNNPAMLAMPELPEE